MKETPHVDPRSRRICALASVAAFAAEPRLLVLVQLEEHFGFDSSSSKSVSDSTSSSSPESNESNYQKDVESYTQAFVVSGGSDTAFMSGIGDLAKKRGITNWEADEHTWIGIGRGLGRTKIDKTQLGVYQTNWSGGDRRRRSS